MKDGDDEVLGVFISVSSLWRVPIILRAHFMIFILCLKTWGFKDMGCIIICLSKKCYKSCAQLCLNLFVRDVCFLIHLFTLIAISLHFLDNTLNYLL